MDTAYHTVRLTEADIERLNRVVREYDYPIRSARSDDGRDFYFFSTTREYLFLRLEPGITFQAVTFDNGRFCLFEIIGIDRLGTPASPTGTGWYY